MTIVGGLSGGTNGLSMSGAGLLTLAGSNTYTGPTTISSGTLRSARAAAATRFPAAAHDGQRRLVFDRGNTATQSTDFTASAITGGGSLTQSGSGTLILNVANSYSGQTNVDARHAADQHPRGGFRATRRSPAGPR